MLLRYFYDEKLAHASYMVGCQKTGEAIVIDPGRNLKPYLETARKEGVRITAATETHIHADFVSGARELAVTQGAKLYLSDEGDENWKYQYLNGLSHELVREGSEFRIGNLVFQVLHTPGHTPESISFLLTDRGGAADKPMGIFTGDFVFVGDVGRPDLLEKAAGVVGTANEGAHAMFHSLGKFKALPDYLQVWPAHGAGSACGKALGAVPSSTVGYEKMFNWALQIEDEAQFVAALLDGQPEPPTYFAVMKRVNKVGPTLLADLATPVNYSTVTAIPTTARVTDTRPNGEFAKGHIAGHLNIPANKSFATWSGWILGELEQHILLAKAEQMEELLVALRSVGLDHVIGWMDPQVALAEMAEQLETYTEMTPAQLASTIQKDEVTLIDVRNLGEWEAGHIAQASHIMLGTLPKRLAEVNTDKTIVIQCQAGGRSAIGASILQANGIKNVINMSGGYARWTQEV